MTNWFRKTLSILCTFSLLFACMTAAFTEETQPETPEEPANSEGAVIEEINPDDLLGAETPEADPANEEELKEEPQEEQGEEGQEEVPEELPEEKPEETPEENVPEQNEPAPEPEEEPASVEAEQNVTATDPADDEQDQGSEEAIHPDTDTAPEETPAENLQEIVSDPMTIQDAVNQAEEVNEPAEEETTTPEAEEEPTQEDETVPEETNTKDTAPADEPEPVKEEQDSEEQNEEENNEEESNTPETEETPAEEETNTEDTTPEDEETEEEPKEGEDEPEEDEEEPEEVILNLNGKTVHRGTVSKAEPVTIKASDDYGHTVVFTLTVPYENVIAVYLDDKQIELTKVDNPDPNSAEIFYTFEKQLNQTKVYDFVLKTESAEQVSFKLKISKKEVSVQDAPEETVEDEAGNEEKDTDNLVGDESESEESVTDEAVEEKTDKETTDELSEEADTDKEINEINEEEQEEEENDLETDEEMIGNEETDTETEAEPEDEGISDGTEELPDNKNALISITWDDEHPAYGSVAHFIAELIGYEEENYTLQWQCSEDGITWINIENATNETMDVIYTEENADYRWRIVVDIIPTEE